MILLNSLSRGVNLPHQLYSLFTTYTAITKKKEKSSETTCPPNLSISHRKYLLTILLSHIFGQQIAVDCLLLHDSNPHSSYKKIRTPSGTTLM